MLSMDVLFTPLFHTIQRQSIAIAFISSQASSVWSGQARRAVSGGATFAKERRGGQESSQYSVARHGVAGGADQVGGGTLQYLVGWWRVEGEGSVVEL